MGSEAEKSQQQSGASKASIIVLGAGLLVAAVSIAYNVIGDDDDAPALQQAGDAPPGIDELRRLAEAASEDARPWSDLGYAHFERGEFADAAGAYERAVAIDPEEAVLWSALGEARVMASERDPLPSDALEAFDKAIKLDPNDPRARYFLAVEKDLADDHEGAIADWLALLEDSPQGAPWEADLVRTIEQVGAINEIDVSARLAGAQAARGESSTSTQAVRGPSEAQLAAAGSIPPSEQRSMAEGMVAQLEARLENEPQNLEGWVMLMRSRMTLGEPDKAQTALESAITANPAKAEQLRAQARQLGVR